MTTTTSQTVKRGPGRPRTRATPLVVGIRNEQEYWPKPPRLKALDAHFGLEPSIVLCHWTLKPQLWHAIVQAEKLSIVVFKPDSTQFKIVASAQVSPSRLINCLTEEARLDCPQISFELYPDFETEPSSPYRQVYCWIDEPGSEPVKLLNISLSWYSLLQATRLLAGS